MFVLEKLVSNETLAKIPRDLDVYLPKARILLAKYGEDIICNTYLSNENILYVCVSFKNCL